VLVSSGPRPLILVVDDDAMQRDLLEAVLQGTGFAVQTAAGAAEAAEFYGRRRADVALVLLDVCMTGTDGPQALQVLRAIDPQVRCCFITGGAGPYTTEELRGLGAAHVFPKPLGDLDAFGRRLRELADGR
jgi:CheY-like chemotaxis protein